MLTFFNLKEILTQEKKHGMALIFLGAAYQDNNKDEAAKYLTIALNESSEESVILLALQGLVSVAKPTELPGIYQRLLELSPEKYLDYYTKIVNLVNQLNDSKPLIKIFCNEIKTEDLDIKYQALKNLLNLFMKNRETAIEEFKDEFLECLEIGFQDKSHVSHVDICRDYFKILYQKGKLEELTKNAEEMTIIYPTNVVPLEWICKIYVENESFAISENLKSNFGVHVEKTLELSPNSRFGLMASGLVKFAIGDLAAARDILVKGKHFLSSVLIFFITFCLILVNNLQTNWSICLRKLALIHEKTRAFLLSELVLREMKDSSVKLAECLIEQQTEDKIREGLEILEKLDDFKSLELKILGQIYLKEFKTAEMSIESMKNTLGVDKRVDMNVFEAKLKRFEGNPSKAVQILEMSESHEAYLELGRNFFDLKRFDECLMSVLKATKLDSYNSECFYWLGKIYLATNDDVRSKKCLEKCLNLNPQHEKAIAILSALYRKNSDWDQNLSLLESSVKSVTGCHQKSAFFQLGLHHLNLQKYDDAITAFRNSLKYDTTNVKTWESLADAYFGRGSYTSALKVFEKSIELNPANNYAKLQVARLKFILQQYRESISDYEKLLKCIPDYLPALKGISESHFGRATYLHDNHRTGRSRDHCQTALNYLRSGKEKSFFLFKFYCNNL